MGMSQRHFWTLRDNPAANIGELAAVAAATVIKGASSAERRLMEQDRLLCLRECIARGGSARAAAHQVLDTLERYSRQEWRADAKLGWCASISRTRNLCFEIMLLSGGKLSARKLQAIFSLVCKKR